MRITDFVDPCAVVFRLRAATREEVLREMAEALAVAHPELRADRVLAVLQERERLGTTGIGQGVAVPHAKLENLSCIVGLVALADQGIDVAAADGRPARIFVAVLSPLRTRTGHLEAMATIGRELGSEPLRRRLLAARGPGEVYGLLADSQIIAGT
jgi:PTS system nitrogen regulatory IIA component